MSVMYVCSVHANASMTTSMTPVWALLTERVCVSMYVCDFTPVHARTGLFLVFSLSRILLVTRCWVNLYVCVPVFVCDHGFPCICTDTGPSVMPVIAFA